MVSWQTQDRINAEVAADPDAGRAKLERLRADRSKPMAKNTADRLEDEILAYSLAVSRLEKAKA